MICLLAGSTIASLMAGAITLAWTHSVEKIVWEEDWRSTPAGLELVEARVRGSGAGMEPPQGAHWHGRFKESLSRQCTVANGCACAAHSTFTTLREVI